MLPSLRSGYAVCIRLLRRMVSRAATAAGAFTSERCPGQPREALMHAKSDFRQEFGEECDCSDDVGRTLCHDAVSLSRSIQLLDKKCNIQSRLIELRTFRSSNLALVPNEDTQNYDKTTWTYESATGLLLAKRDAANKGADYTYTPDGKLSTRTWARGIVTTYAYDTANRLVSTDYSDNTPDVTMSYDRLNRQLSVSNGIAKSEFAHNPATLAVTTETISYNLDGQPGFEFSRVLDRSQDTLGRDTGWQLKDGTNIENSAAYQYSATEGRLSKVLGLASSSLPSPEFAYGYAAGSSLIASITGPIHTVTNAYEPNRNVLSSKQNKAGTEILSKFDYSVNQLFQRESVATSGTAFPALPSWVWGYDVLGQVTSANHSADNNYDRAYQYDTIGNRLQGSAGVSPNTVSLA